MPPRQSWLPSLQLGDVQIDLGRIRYRVGEATSQVVDAAFLTAGTMSP